MKTILVLTDFSENALKAAEAAAMLSGALRANLLLFNANYTVPAVPFYPGVMLANENISWEDECEDKLNQLAAHLKKIISEANVDKRKPSIHTLLREGDLSNNIKNIIKEEKVELIVMGGRSGSNIDHIVFGSDISAVIDHASCPVLIVAPGSPFTRLHRVVFATNFSQGDREAITYLIELGKLFQYQLEIVHVSLFGNLSLPENPLVFDFLKSLAEKNYPNVIYSNIRGKNLIQRLIDFCKEREAGVLAFTHQHHSYLASILKGSIVKKSIAKQKLPLFIFPSELQHKHNDVKKESLTGYIL